MLSVRKLTTWFRKLSLVSTFATPDGHLAAVSTVDGGTRPRIQPEAQCFSMTTLDGATPVSTVAW